MNKGDTPRKQSIKPTSLLLRQTRLSLQIDERPVISQELKLLPNQIRMPTLHGKKTAQ